MPFQIERDFLCWQTFTLLMKVTELELEYGVLSQPFLDSSILFTDCVQL